MGFAEDSLQRAAEFDRRLDRLEQIARAARSEAEGHLRSMASVGVLSRLLGKSDQLWAAFAHTLESHFHARTEAEASRFARTLLHQLASESRLAADRVNQTLSRFLDVASRLRQSQDDILQALSDPDSRRWSLTVGNFSVLANVPLEILQQPHFKDELRSLVRSRLEAFLSGPRRLDEFGLLTDRHIRDVLVSAGLTFLSDKATELANIPRSAPVFLNSNEVDALLQQTSGNEHEIKRILDLFVRSAQVMIAPDRVEIARRQPGMSPLDWQRYLSIYIPDVSTGDVLRSMVRSLTREATEIWSTRSASQVTALGPV